MAWTVSASTPPMTRLPNMADHEAERGADHSARQRAGDRRDLEIQQAARHHVAPHSSEDDGPGRGRPPERADDAGEHRAAVDQRLATRRVKVVGQRVELALRRCCPEAASPSGQQDGDADDDGNHRGPQHRRLLRRKQRLFGFLQYQNTGDRNDHQIERPGSAAYFPFVAAGGVCFSQTKRCRKSLLRLKMSIQRAWISDSWTSSGMTVSS